jgi:hypothetical protein
MTRLIYYNLNKWTIPYNHVKHEKTLTYLQLPKENAIHNQFRTVGIVHLKFINCWLSREVLENSQLILPRKCWAEFEFPLFRIGGPRSRGSSDVLGMPCACTVYKETTRFQMDPCSKRSNKWPEPKIAKEMQYSFMTKLVPKIWTVQVDFVRKWSWNT